MKNFYFFDIIYIENKKGVNIYMKRINTWSDCALKAQARGMVVDWDKRFFYCPSCKEKVDGGRGEMNQCPYCNFNFFNK